MTRWDYTGVITEMSFAETGGRMVSANRGERKAGR